MKSLRSIQSNTMRKAGENVRQQHFMGKLRGEGRYKYLDSLIKYSELCLTGATKAPSYGTDLSNLCLEILGKDTHIWYQEFQQQDQLIELVSSLKTYFHIYFCLLKDQRIEYFLQNCLLIIENSKQVQKIILMSLTQLSCIDYPKDERVQTLGSRCVTILKNILSKGDDLKDLVEKSILEIIIQNIKIENWLMISEIQVSGVISFLEVPNIASLFIVDEEIFPLMHRWVQQITDFIGKKEECYENDDDDEDESSQNLEQPQKKYTQNLIFSKNFHKAHQILKISYISSQKQIRLIDMCMKNKHLINKFVEDDTDKNYLLKMYYNFLKGVELEFLKFLYQGEQFIIFYEFQITILALIEKLNIVLEEKFSNEQLKQKQSYNNVQSQSSLQNLNLATIANLQSEERDVITVTKLQSEDIEKFTNFAFKHIKGQIGYEYKQFSNTKFYESMESILNVKEDARILEKNRKVVIMRHFAQLIRTAGSFQGQLYQKEIIPVYFFHFLLS